MDRRLLKTEMKEFIRALCSWPRGGWAAVVIPVASARGPLFEGCRDARFRLGLYMGRMSDSGPFCVAVVRCFVSRGVGCCRLLLLATSFCFCEGVVAGGGVRVMCE